jgi:hypothetical protein
MRRSRGPDPQRFQSPRRAKKRRWEVLDRPVTLTLFGTFGLGLLTLYWQTSEARRATEQTYQRALLDQRFELVRTLTKAYQKSANVLNAKVFKTLVIAERRNALGEALDDPENEKKKRDIDDIVRDVKELDKEFAAMEPLDGVSAQLELLFDSPEVPRAAQKLREKWIDFEVFANRVALENNDPATRRKMDIAAFKKERAERAAELDDLKNALLAAIRDEITATRSRDMRR